MVGRLNPMGETTMHKMRILLIAAMLGVSSPGSADEQAIQDIYQQWLEFVAKKDAAAVAGFYASDAQLLPPNSATIKGREDIQRFWEQSLQAANMQFTFQPTSVTASKNSDMAYDIGTYQYSFDGPQGRVEDKGKFVH